MHANEDEDDHEHEHEHEHEGGIDSELRSYGVTTSDLRSVISSMA